LPRKSAAGAGGGKGGGGGDGGDGEYEDDTEGRKINPAKAVSKIWKQFKPYRGKIKTNGLSGKDRRYYEWDYLHNEIEMYNQDGDPIDAIDPRTGARLFKDVSRHKPIDL
jgi:hypothetical protein